jgi:hypothetical protein
LLDSVGANVTTYQHTNLTPNTNYCYRVNTRTYIFNSGYSNTVFVRTPLPTPTQKLPVNGATNQPLNPNFSWSFIFDIDFYHLQVSTTENFSSLVFNDSNLTSGFFTMPLGILENGNTYYWRVRTRTSDNYSYFSPTWSFQLPVQMVQHLILME